MCLRSYICWLTKIEQKDNKQFVYVQLQLPAQVDDANLSV